MTPQMAALTRILTEKLTEGSALALTKSIAPMTALITVPTPVYIPHVVPRTV